MQNEKPSIGRRARKVAGAAALLLTVSAVAFVGDAAWSAQYKRTVIKDNFMKFPANAIAIGMHGALEGKIIGALGMRNSVEIMDPDSGQVIRSYSLPDYPVKGVDDVSEGPDGTLYWSNAAFGTIGYVKPDGTTGEFEGIGWVNSIAASRDGNWLYFGACIGKDELWRVELGQDGLPKPGGVREMVQAQPGWSNSMDASADGYIYAPTNLYGTVRRIHPASGKVEQVWEGLGFPSAIDVNDATGILYSTEFHLGNITRIDLEKGYSRVLAKLPPATDNVAASDDSIHPRIFGSSFVADHIVEVYENGDDARIISEGGLHFMGIEILGDRVFIRDMGRIMEYHPKAKRFENIAWGQFGDYIDGKSHDWGPQRYDPKKLSWQTAMQDVVTIPFGKVMRLTPDGKSLIAAGNMAELVPNSLTIIDVETREKQRQILDLPHLEDAVMVGDDLYVIAQKVPESMSQPRPNETYLANAGPSMEGLKGESWEILRIGKDGQRTSVFQAEFVPVAPDALAYGSNTITAFAQRGGDVYMTDVHKGVVYQVAKGDTWLDQPAVIARGLKGPEGISFSNDGTLLVLENNEADQDGHNGRLVKVNASTGAVEVLYTGLGISKKLNPANFQVLVPHAPIGQTPDGSIYLYEPGYTSFTVLEPVS